MSDNKRNNPTIQEIFDSQDEYREATGYAYDFSPEEIDGECEEEVE